MKTTMQPAPAAVSENRGEVMSRLDALNKEINVLVQAVQDLADALGPILVEDRPTPVHDVGPYASPLAGTIGDYTCRVRSITDRVLVTHERVAL
jgi:hypothetical protein